MSIGNKICLIAGSAPIYREEIFVRLGQELGVDFVVGAGATKQMDRALLPNKVIEIVTTKIWKLPLYRQSDVIRLSKGYDYIIANLGIMSISEWLLLIVARLRHQKIYAWGHCWYGKEGVLKEWLKKFYYKKFDGIFLYGNRARNLMVERGFDANKLFVVYNSLAYKKQKPLRDSLANSRIYKNHYRNANRNIIFIGRLRKVKRFDLLIEAVARLKQKGELVNVTFIGDGEERSNIERLAAERDIECQLWFYGESFDEKTNAELIYNADLCVSPGNIGLTAIHVLMFGCPAITNDDFSHQMPEFEAIEEGVTGAFFRAGDSEALADAIHRWFSEHDNDRDKVRQSCYAVIDEKWNSCAQIKTFRRGMFGGN